MMQEDRKIGLIGALIFIGLTLASGISVYFVMLKQTESILSMGLQALAQHKVQLIEGKIHEAVIDTRKELIRPFLLQNLQKHNQEPENALLLSNLQYYAEVLLRDNFTAVSIYDIRGKEVAQAGSHVKHYNAMIPVEADSISTFLIWENGFVVRTHADIYNNEGLHLGSVAFERYMPILTSIFSDVNSIGKTGEIELCAPQGAGDREMVCYLSTATSAQVELSHMPRAINGAALLMDYALKGISGMTLNKKHYRQVTVIGVYVPIKSLGLGFVLKLDEDELYTPITSQLKQVVLNVILLIAAGIFMLYWLVRPLMRKLIQSEHELRERLKEGACLYTVRKELLSKSPSDEVCQQIIVQLTRAMQFPEITAVKIELDDKCYVSANYSDDLTYGLYAEIRTRDLIMGQLQVFYIKNKPFLLPEEQNLLDLIAIDLARWQELIQAERRILFSATHDELTNLPNRRLLQDRIAQVLAQCSRNQNQAAVLFIDLDNFKIINDSLGHDVGDILLKQVANRLVSCVRGEDTVARQGGDEFIVVLSDIDSIQSASAVAQKILDVLVFPFLIGDKEMHIGCSIGITLFPDDGMDVDTLLKNSDTAMYHAKSAGRNNYQFFAPNMNQQIAERHMLESELRNAIKQNELLLHFQPVVSMPGKELRGIEALLRWQHPRLGLISPLKFIPLAEESGLIVPIGEWVLKATCQQIKTWQDQGYTVPKVAINLSVRQFRHRSLVADIERILDETGVAAYCLTLEITESMLAQDVYDVANVLNQISMMELDISMDDFGTGYSNLSYLKRFPIDTLKIDRSFVRDIATDSNDSAIIEAIIAMAHSLNIRVIAEGVETEDQLNFLQQRGCDCFQGFYFSMPLTVEEMAHVMEKDVKRLVS